MLVRFDKMEVEDIVQNYLGVYLNVNDENESIVSSLRKVMYSIKIFTNLDECVDFISDLTDAKIFLIVSHSIDEFLASVIHQFRQVYAIFLMSSHDQSLWSQKYSKINVDSIPDPSSLCHLIQVKKKQFEKELLSISVLNELTNDEIAPVFMYIQLLKESFLEMQFGADDIQKFAAIARENNKDNPETVNAINLFEKEYSQHSPIWW
jgi:hypothetical protein